MEYKCDGCGNPTDNIYHDSDFMSKDFIQRLRDKIEWENEQSNMWNITCPWCGYENLDSWEYEDSEDEVECGECGKLFDLEVCHEITYTTKKSVSQYEEDKNDE